MKKAEPDLDEALTQRFAGTQEENEEVEKLLGREDEI